MTQPTHLEASRAAAAAAPTTPAPMAKDALRIECVKLAISAEAKQTVPTSIEDVVRAARVVESYVSNG